MKKLCLIFFLFPILLLSKEDMTSLLSDLAQKADLSNQTKKESAGFLIIYTRQDLDRMKVHYLKEIIDQIPLIRYNENALGMTSPFYVPYQPEAKNTVRVYVNDRELITSYTGSKLKLFAQVNIDFIDHIEIYHGTPSQSLGIQSAFITIKCYTKNPKRENTNVLKTEVGSYGSKMLSIYSAKTYKEYSYLLFANATNLNRKKVHHNNIPLSEDKKIKYFFGSLQKENIRWEMQASRGKLDTFMGISPNIDPKDPHIDFDFFYTGVYYKNRDNGIKASLNYSRSNMKNFDSSYSVLGVIPPNYIYQDLYKKIRESVANAQILKAYESRKNKFTIGIQSRYKHFTIPEYRLGVKNMANSGGYSSEFIFSSFLENRYSINNSNIITASIKYDKMLENANITNYDTYSARLGYIYNSLNWTSKTFIFTGESSPSMQILYDNSVLYHKTYDLDKTKVMVFATQLTRKTKKYTTSITLGHMKITDGCYFNFATKGYLNSKDKYTTNSVLLDYKYFFNPQNKVIFNGWSSILKRGNSSNKRVNYGAFISLYDTIDRFDFYNSLVFKKWDGIDKNGWNFNSTISYRYSRKLSLFVKGENIFNKALKSNYIRIVPSMPPVINRLSEVSPIDRRVWIGLEYQF